MITMVNTERRGEYNEKLLNILKEYLEKHPEIRFGQALINLGMLIENHKIIDAMDASYYVNVVWNEEPERMFERVERTINHD